MSLPRKNWHCFWQDKARENATPVQSAVPLKGQGHEIFVVLVCWHRIASPGPIRGSLERF